jgi:hypothetical protein
VQWFFLLLGLFFHAQEDLRTGSGLWFQSIINGAPPMAPLLFANLVPLGLIALWVLYQSASEPRA